APPRHSRSCSRCAAPYSSPPRGTAAQSRGLVGRVAPCPFPKGSRSPWRLSISSRTSRACVLRLRSRVGRPQHSERLPSSMGVHVVGAGPVGLLLTALLQSMEGVSVRLYEKRREYTRTRMVQLAPYLVADSVESYRADEIDGDSVEAIFDPAELDQSLAFRQS